MTGHEHSKGEAERAAADEPKTFYEILKEQLGILALLVVLAGISVTEAYYWEFGIRYQMLSLSAQHLLYRGLTSLVSAPYVAGPYLGCMVWLALTARNPAKSRTSALLRRPAVGYLLGVGLMLATYVLGLIAGGQAARTDMTAGTTTLPQVVSMSPSSLATPGEGYRMLLLQGDFVAVFKPLPVWRANERPILKLVRSSSLEEIELAR